MLPKISPVPRFLPSFLLGVVLCTLRQGAIAQADPYAEYLRTSEDFRSVKQEKEWALKAFPTWTFMPWTFQWTIGYTAESGKWSREHGYNGAFVDRDWVEAAGSKTGRLDWIDQFQLRFYVDHTADKGLLHLWDGDKLKPHLAELHGTGTRPVPLNGETMEKLKTNIRKNVVGAMRSPYRAAYALDDELSWGHFVHPTMWQVTDDAEAYSRWLSSIYGKQAPRREKWVSYDDIRPNLPDWDVAHFDASPLMDQWSFNDSTWNNYLGSLVNFTNSIDPATPCGFVGGQAPSPFGGYDYAKLMRKVQFIESYNLGSSQALIRSFNPGNALPAVTSVFHKSSADSIWQAWYYLAQGNRGHIGWVEGWFDGSKPKPWHDEVGLTYREIAEKISPLMKGAEWKHDGIAILYSHPSIQLGWILDAQAHGKTWVNRNSDERLSSSNHVRHAWENMLRDSGLQFTYLSYADLGRSGVPAEYKVLILPAALALSDAEAEGIRTFCQNGGTVIADYLPGVWDQHGRGREKGGVLDKMFGIPQPGTLRSKDLFSGGDLWVEVNQDANFDWKECREFLTKENKCILDASGFHRAIRDLEPGHVATFGQGRAVLMNLSPQWYNAYRVEGVGPASKRDVFIKQIAAAGVKRRVSLKGAGEVEHGYEITYWKLPALGRQASRTLMFVFMNPEISGTSLGGGNSVNLKSATVTAELEFTKTIQDARDERTGKDLGRGEHFSLPWKQNEALVVSFLEN